MFTAPRTDGSVRNASQHRADIYILVYTGRDAIVDQRETPDNRAALVEWLYAWCRIKRRADAQGADYILARKSEAYIGRAIVAAAMLNLHITVERGEDWQ